MSKYVSATKIQERFGVSSSSLRRWEKDGRVNTIRTPGRFRLYDIGDVEHLFQQEKSTPEPEKEKICYARVSSDHQKKDLERQIEDLKTKYPNHKIIKDIGSGNEYHIFFELKIFQGSITNAKVFLPFWNEYTKEMSLKLSVPTEIDCVDMDLNSLNLSSRRLAQVSII